ncbi:hypothetical protein, partial [Morganella morganii]|uniref:hypothetical protein n=1 Tax=Morganella morganii TaxID=582 RepID=UPI001EF7CB9D
WESLPSHLLELEEGNPEVLVEAFELLPFFGLGEPVNHVANGHATNEGNAEGHAANENSHGSRLM